MTDYKKLVKALRCDWMPDDSCKRKCPYADSHGYCDMDKVRSSAADAIEALLPKRGEWIVRGANRVDCSVCGHSICFAFGLSEGSLMGYNYCPNCGAKMEVQDEA